MLIKIANIRNDKRELFYVLIGKLFDSKYTIIYGELLIIARQDRHNMY